MSHKSQRLSWRARCRRWQCYINALLAVLVALVVASTPALAAPRCPGGTATANGCSYQIDRNTRCVWPLVWQGGTVAMCVRLAVQP